VTKNRKISASLVVEILPRRQPRAVLTDCINAIAECCLPEQEKFPYTIRVVSETLESNGSSLSLMDVGVPISASSRSPSTRS